GQPAREFFRSWLHRLVRSDTFQTLLRGTTKVNAKRRTEHKREICGKKNAVQNWPGRMKLMCSRTTKPDHAEHDHGKVSHNGTSKPDNAARVHGVFRLTRTR